MRLVGDIHGKLDQYLAIVKNTPSVQVGDYGIGFVEVPILPSYNRFIRGNHDNPHMCKTNPNWIKDGTVEDGTMYIGGAWSIDQAFRQEGISWWREEELSITEFNELFDLYCKVKPNIMITHDCPTSVAFDMFISKGNSLNGDLIKTRTGEALQVMFEAHQPEFHFFGHWHYTNQMTIKGTRFICLGELDYLDIDTSSTASIHDAVNNKFAY